MTSGALTVRVGVSFSPFAADGLAGGDFWSAVDALEALGYDSLWLSDTATGGGVAPLPALAAVAARTRRLKLGTGVLVLPPRNPVLLARELATVDAISGGRLLPAGGIGIGDGPELEALAVPRAERAARLEESLSVIRLLWTGAPVTHRGRFWSLTDVTLAPRPVRPRLEFWLGGSAPEGLRRVGRIADGWLGAFVGPDEFAAKVELIRAAAADAGRSIDEDHFGTTLFAAPSAAQIPAAVHERLQRAPGLTAGDHIAHGAEQLRVLLTRFRAAGATKFVVVPIADQLLPWLREMYEHAVAPVEAAR